MRLPIALEKYCKYFNKRKDYFSHSLIIRPIQNSVKSIEMILTLFLLFFFKLPRPQSANSYIWFVADSRVKLYKCTTPNAVYFELRLPNCKYQIYI